jgi:uncharacterized RDD family membrane protein YckC
MSGYAGVHADGETSLARAWPRFWARQIDIILYSFVGGLLFALAFPASVNAIVEWPAGELLLGILLLPFALVLDAAVLALAGGSIGKLLAGIRFQTVDGGRPSLETALRRNLILWTRGLWLGLPLLVLIGYSKAYGDVQADGRTAWDEATGTVMADGSGNELRTLLVGAVAIGLMILDRALARMDW